MINIMKDLDPTFISLCNYAIPSNDILNDGLGDLLLQNISSEIKLLRKDLFLKYEDFFIAIKNILAENDGVIGFAYSDIVDQLVSIYGKEKCFPFYKDLNFFCAQAYFSNIKVLDAYELLPSSKEKYNILTPEADNSMFFKIIKK